MPFIVTPEGKILAQSGAILKYICKKGGKQNYILQSFRFTRKESGFHNLGKFCLWNSESGEILLVELQNQLRDPEFHYYLNLEFEFQWQTLESSA